MDPWNTLQQSVFNIGLIGSTPQSRNGASKQYGSLLSSFEESDPLSTDDDLHCNDESPCYSENCTALYRWLGSSFSGASSTNHFFSKEETTQSDDCEWWSAALRRSNEIHMAQEEEVDWNANRRSRHTDAAAVVSDDRIEVDEKGESESCPQLLLHGFSRDSIQIPLTWSDVAYQVRTEEDVPAGRFGHTAVLFQREMYVFGGKGENGYLNDVLCYNLDTQMWARYTPSASWTLEEKRCRWPCPRSCHAAALVGDRMYVLSGEVRPQKGVPDLWSFHFETKTWRLESSTLPFSPRKGHTMHFLPSTHTAERSKHHMLVVFGGMVCDGSPTNEVFLYNLGLKKWSRLVAHGDAPAPRAFHVAQLVEQTSQLLVFGGRTVLPTEGRTSSPSTSPDTPDANYLNDLFVLDVSTGRWTRKHGPPGSLWPFPLSCCCSVFANGVFALFCGGNNAKCCTTCFEYHVESGEWKRVAIAKQPVCSRPTVVYAGNQLVLFGGCTSGGCLLSKTLMLPLPPLSLRDSGSVWLKHSALQQKLLASTHSHHSYRLQQQRQFEETRREAYLHRETYAVQQQCGGYGYLQRPIHHFTPPRFQSSSHPVSLAAASLSFISQGSSEQR